MNRDFSKTLSFLALHLLVGFSVAYAFTGSIALAGGIALIEPCVNAVVFFFHERAWRGELSLKLPSARLFSAKSLSIKSLAALKLAHSTH